MIQAAQAALTSLASSALGWLQPQIQLLQGDGSDRLVFRLRQEQKSLIGVVHQDTKENRDFFAIGQAMAQAGIPVPQVLAVAPDQRAYLQDDLGAFNLAQKLEVWQEEGQEDKILKAYRQVLNWLVPIQEGLNSLKDYGLPQMNQASLQQDLAYFKTNFLGIFQLEPWWSPEADQELEQILVPALARLEPQFFVYRDFQSRNIMWHQESPWFIDFQSAQWGSRYYDLASLLYASKAFLHNEQRQSLLQHYYGLLSDPPPLQEFLRDFAFTLMARRLRSLGSYGYLSQVKGKASFYPSIAPSLEEMLSLCQQWPELAPLVQVKACLQQIHQAWQNRQPSPGP